MAKELRFSDEARDLLMAGVDQLAEAVKSTLGPKGRNVILEKITGSPVVTNDGVTIAREIHLKNQFQNMGAQLVKEAAIKTNDIVGDGTTTEKITKVQQLMPLLDKIMREPRPLVIVAEAVEGTALSMLVHNHANGIFQCVAVRAPGFGDRRLHKLEDIAALTGGDVLSKHSGFTLETMTTSQLGRAAQVRVTADRTAIVGGAGSGDAVAFRVAQLRAELERATFGVDEDVLTERIGALTGKVAVIKVGAPTDAELKELQHRVEDALSATRAAMAEGIVAGGGAALLHAEQALDDLGVTGDYATGVEIVRRVLAEPAYLIATNAGYAGQEIVAKMAGLGRDEGFDALAGRFGNMIEMGIIDPLRVARSALQNGASVAGLLLTTSTLVAEEQTPWGGSAALMTEFGPLDEGLNQPSPDASTPQSLGLGPSIG